LPEWSLTEFWLLEVWHRGIPRADLMWL